MQHVDDGQGGIRALRDGDTSTVNPPDDDIVIPAHQVRTELRAPHRAEDLKGNLQ